MAEYRDRSKCNTGLALLLAALVLVTCGPAWAGGLVLCVCHDGHVSLETTCQPLDCCPDGFAVDATNTGDMLVCADASEEHPCVDVPLLLYSGKLVLVPAKMKAPSPSNDVIGDLPSEPAEIRPAVAAARVVAMNSPLLPSETPLTRSTVLLI